MSSELMPSYLLSEAGICYLTDKEYTCADVKAIFHCQGKTEYVDHDYIML